MSIVVCNAGGKTDDVKWLPIIGNLNGIEQGSLVRKMMYSTTAVKNYDSVKIW